MSLSMQNNSASFWKLPSAGQEIYLCWCWISKGIFLGLTSFQLAALKAWDMLSASLITHTARIQDQERVKEPPPADSRHTLMFSDSSTLLNEQPEQTMIYDGYILNVSSVDCASLGWQRQISETGERDDNSVKWNFPRWKNQRDERNESWEMLSQACKCRLLSDVLFNHWEADRKLACRAINEAHV